MQGSVEVSGPVMEQGTGNADKLTYILMVKTEAAVWGGSLGF